MATNSNTCSAADKTVQNIQRMLRTLSYVHRNIPRLTPNGCFDQRTADAVMVFQRNAGLPVTGTVDQTTWNSLIEEYFRVARQLAPPRSVSLFSASTQPIHPGESSPILYPIQGMFCALAGVLDEVQAVPPSGVLDAQTAANLRWLQRSGGLEETGILDRNTWDLLCRLYETFVSRTFPRQVMGAT